MTYIHCIKTHTTETGAQWKPKFTRVDAVDRFVSPCGGYKVAKVRLLLNLLYQWWNTELTLVKICQISKRLRSSKSGPRRPLAIGNMYAETHFYSTHCNTMLWRTATHCCSTLIHADRRLAKWKHVWERTFFMIESCGVWVMVLGWHNTRQDTPRIFSASMYVWACALSHSFSISLSPTQTKTNKLSLSHTHTHTHPHTHTQTYANAHRWLHIALQSKKHPPPKSRTTLNHPGTLAVLFLGGPSVSTLGRSLQHSATHCNALQHAATHCNTL